jgi:hypothetical protein
MGAGMTPAWNPLGFSGRFWSLGPEGQLLRGNNCPFAELLFLKDSVGEWTEEEKHWSRSEPLILSVDKMPFLMRGSDLRGKSDSRFKWEIWTPQIN